MAAQGMLNIARKSERKIQRRAAETGTFVWRESVPVTDVGRAETTERLAAGEA